VADTSKSPRLRAEFFQHKKLLCWRILRISVGFFIKLKFMLEEETTKKTTKKLEDLDEEQRKAIVEKWKKRFKKAKDFRKPYQDKWLRMYQLYRAYKERTKYAYETKLMPPIAFEIIETVKPRLAAAKINIRILPRSKNDVNSPAIEAWDDKIKYDLDEIKFTDRKIDWINSALLFGNGVLGLVWNPGKDGEDGDPFAWIQDLWLFYPDPEATSLQEDSKWEIVQIFKKKEELEKEEKARGENKIYRNLENVKNKKITDDPRKERYEINTKKMGQIATASGNEEQGTASEEKIVEEKVELWEIWDHEEDMLLVIANGEELIRYEENPYKNVNGGRIFIDLADHALLWELWSIGHIEPVETTIHEIADSRNQAMDDITFTLDPIRKVRKDAHITADDIVYEPGAIWELKRADDVITERPPEISRQWLEKDALLRKEIQMALAISEYAMGLPKSTTEPKSKVDLLLLQTNIRFSLLLRQFEIAVTQLVNNLIELNQEFLTKDKAYRLIGDEVEFKEFKQADKKVKVDAIVEIEPKVEKTPMQKQTEILMLYKTFVIEDRPDPKDEEEVKQWKIRKRTLQKMILEEFGKEQYEDLILGPEKKEKEKKKEKERKEEKPEKPPETLPGPSEISPVSPTPSIKTSTGIKGVISRIPLLKRIVT